MSYRVNPTVHRIHHGSSEFGGAIGSYILDYEKDLVLIDVGPHANSAKVILSYIETELHRSASQVKHIILTSWNPHVSGGLKKARDEFSEASVHMHQALAEVFQDPLYFARNKAFSILPKRHDNAIKSWVRGVPKNIEEVELFKDGAKIKTENGKVLIVSFEGQTAGHSMVFDTVSKALFTGSNLNFVAADPYSYCFDLSGNFLQYRKALEFLERASYKIICPSTDEAYLTNAKPWVHTINEAIRTDIGNIKKVLQEYSGSTALTITKKWQELYGDNRPVPLNLLFTMPIVYSFLEFFVKRGESTKDESSSDVRYYYSI